MASLPRYLKVDLNLVGLCDRNVGLNTKCAMVEVSENVEGDEPLSRPIVEMINTKKQNTC